MGTLRAFSVALFLGTAAFVGHNYVIGAAHAASVRPAVGKPLQQAQELAAKGDYKAALEQIKKADATPKKTPEEEKVIDQMRNYVVSKSGSASVYEQMIAQGKGSATVARNLIRAHYMQKDYKKVIADAAILRKYGAMDASARALIAQAYYLSGDYAGTIRFLKGHTDIDSLKLIYGAAFKLHDMDAIQSSLEQLILATGNVDYWRGGIEIAEHQRPLTDHQSLDLLRLRLLTGTMRPTAGGDDDYSQLAQIAIQLGFPGEAEAVLQKGMDVKVVSGERAQRLMKMASNAAAKQKAALAQQEAAAKTGDDLVQVGEAYAGFGNTDKALSLIQAGIKKGVTNKYNAQMALGEAYLAKGQREAAAKAFAAVPKADTKGWNIAHLFNIYARSKVSQAANTPHKARKKH
jgi:hypothetical protein